jgi:predicted aminopeptidase
MIGLACRRHLKAKLPMAAPKRSPAAWLHALLLTLCVAVAPLAGCDSSSTVKEIPENAKQALNKRKADVSPGQAKSSRTGGTTTRNRASGR